MKLAGLDVADPIAAAAWLEKQYDISGEAMFGKKDYSQGDSLVLGMNAAQIGTAGGKLIWTLVMLGAGKGASGSAKATLATLGVLGNFDGIITSATNIANLVETLQKQDKLTIGALLTNAQFLEEVTKLTANIFGAISAGMGTNTTVSQATKATFARVGILLDLAQVSVMVGKLVEITTSEMNAQNKESAAGQVVAELITSAASIVAGAAEYKKEHGKSSAAEEQGKPPPKLLEGHPGEGTAQKGETSKIETGKASEGLPPNEQPAMDYGNIPETQLQGETTPASQEPVRTTFEENNELTQEVMEARQQKNSPESERAVGSPGTAKHGESESRTHENYRLYTPAEVALGLRTDFSPEHHGYIRSVEFEVPNEVGNFGTRGDRFNQDQLLNEINVEHMTHETLTNTNTERGHAAAQQLSGGDPDVAAALMTISNIWPMRGRGPTGVNQGDYRQFEERYIDFKAANPDSRVTVRVEAVVGANPTFITGQDGRQTLVPDAFDTTITITPPDGPPQVIPLQIPNQ